MTDFEDRVTSIAERLLNEILYESVRREPHVERSEPPKWGEVPPDLRRRLDSMHDIASEAVHFLDGWINHAVTVIANAPEDEKSRRFEALRQQLDEEQ